MADKPNIIQIEILGTKLQLRGGDDPEGVKKVGNYVRDMVHSLAEKAPTTPSLQIALLAAINIADELYQQSRQENDDMEHAVTKANRILAKLERS